MLELGWQSITYAFTDHPDVWVERFGNQAFTVHNWGDEPADFPLSVDLHTPEFPSTDLTVYESISEGFITATVTGEGYMQFKGQLEPNRTAVYWLDKREDSIKVTDKNSPLPLCISTSTLSSFDLMSLPNYSPDKFIAKDCSHSIPSGGCQRPDADVWANVW